MFGPNDPRLTIFRCQATESIPSQMNRKDSLRPFILAQSLSNLSTKGPVKFNFFFLNKFLFCSLPAPVWCSTTQLFPNDYILSHSVTAQLESKNASTMHNHLPKRMGSFSRGVRNWRSQLWRSSSGMQWENLPFSGRTKRSGMKKNTQCEAKQFPKLHKMEYNEKMRMPFKLWINGTLNSVQLRPLAEDLKKLKRYHEEGISSEVASMQQNPSVEGWKALGMLVLGRITLLNKHREAAVLPIALVRVKVFNECTWLHTLLHDRLGKCHCTWGITKTPPLHLTCQGGRPYSPKDPWHELDNLDNTYFFRGVAIDYMHQVLVGVKKSWLWWGSYQSLRVHQHQKGHTVPKQV